MILSIIIPTYNSQSTIIRAIESCIIEKLYSIEIIIIDDGSTDKTVELIRNKFYRLMQNKTIRIFQANHNGAGEARNIGLKMAQGKWILFLDSDDELCNLNNVLDDLTDNRLDDGIDIFNYFEKGKLNEAYIINGKNYIKENLGLCRYTQWNSRPSHKIYKRDFLDNNNIIFPTNIKVGEDLVFNLKCLIQQPSVLTKHFKMYKINENSNSITHRILKDDIYGDTVKLVNTVLEFPLKDKIIKIFIAKSFSMMLVRFLKSNYSVSDAILTVRNYIDIYPIKLRKRVVIFYKLREVLGLLNAVFFFIVWTFPSVLNISFNMIRQIKYR